MAVGGVDAHIGDAEIWPDKIRLIAHSPLGSLSEDLGSRSIVLEQRGGQVRLVIPAWTSPWLFIRPAAVLVVHEGNSSAAVPVFARHLARVRRALPAAGFDVVEERTRLALRTGLATGIPPKPRPFD